MGDFKKRGGFGGGNDRRGGGGFRGGSSFGGGSRFGGRGGDRDSRPAEMFSTTCAECHKTCEVPFRPNGEKPVYCSDCFRNKSNGPSDYPRRESRDRDFAPKREFSAPRPQEGANSSDLKRQIETISIKLDRLIEMLQKNASANQSQSASKRVDAVELSKVVNKAVLAPKKEEKKAPVVIAKKAAPAPKKIEVKAPLKKKVVSKKK